MRDIESVTLLSPQPTSPGKARRFVARGLVATGHGDALDVAELLVSELVTNALLHARTEMRLRLLVNGERVRVEVHDNGGGTAETRDYGAEASTGRGLLLVEQLSAAWGAEATEQGKVVWFELAAADDRACVGAAT